MGSWTAGGGNSCGAEQNVAGSDATTTGPNAVALSSLGATRETSTWRLVVIALGGLTGFGVNLWWTRGRRPQHA